MIAQQQNNASMKTVETAIHAQNNVYRRRYVTNKIMLALSIGALVFGLIWLVWILETLIVRGGGSLSIALFTEMTPPPGAQGGLLNAIAGSLAMVGVCLLYTSPSPRDGLLSRMPSSA